MLQAGTAFIGGVMAANRIADMSFPQFSRAVDEGEKFRLYVRVISASIPSLADPGLLKRERPRLEVVLGDARKMTEFGDFKRDSTDPGEGDPALGGSAPSTSPWHFGDTLTFLASGADVLGPGVQVWLRSNSDVNLGMFQVNLAQMREIGTCSVNLRTGVLPHCGLRNQGAQAGAGVGSAADLAAPQQIWETPPTVLPLAHVGADNSPYVLAEAAAHVTVTFGVNVDPQALLTLADQKTRPLAERVATPLRQWIQEPVRWVYEASANAANCHACEPDGPRVARGSACPAGLDLPRARGIVSARAAEVFEAATAGGCSPTCDLDSSPVVMQVPGRIVTPRTGMETTTAFLQGPGVMSPDLKSDGWVSHVGPNGRQFWHHMSLGPPPWELQAAAAASGAGVMGYGSPTSRAAVAAATAPARTPSSSSSAVAPAPVVPFPKPLTLPLQAAAGTAVAALGAVAGPGTPVSTPYARMRQAAFMEQQREAGVATSDQAQAETVVGQAAMGSGTPVARPVAEESAMTKILERSVPTMCKAYVSQAGVGHVLHTTRRGLPARQSFQVVESTAPSQRGLPARQSFQAVEAHHGHAGLPARTSFAAVAEPVWMVSGVPIGGRNGQQAFTAAPAAVVVGAYR